MLAYHNKPEIKEALLAQLKAHRLADEIIKGVYWENGKGCAVGCTVHSGYHTEYETKLGIPIMLARLEDVIFEGLPNEVAKLWPERFAEAINVGADLSLVGWEFQYWLLTTEAVNLGINHPLVKDAVRQCADLMNTLRLGGEVTAESAENAVKSAESVRNTITHNYHAKNSAYSAINSAYSAYNRVHDAAQSAYNAAESARDVAKNVNSAIFSLMAGKLIELISTKGEHDHVHQSI